MMATKPALAILALFYLLPVCIALAWHQFTGVGGGWWTADRTSIGLLPPAASHPGAVVRVFSAPTVRWRGAVAVHCWIVLKAEGATAYTRYDYTAWGDPIRRNGFEPDGRWFGQAPAVVFAADGEAAAALIPRMQASIDAYRWRHRGDYSAWPAPNSNTFVAAVLDAVPEVRVALPPTAIGKDYPYDGRWLRRTASGGLRLTLGGYVGLTIGGAEGLEVNLLGGVMGIDFMRPAVKLPGLGRLGMAPAASSPG